MNFSYDSAISLECRSGSHDVATNATHDMVQIFNLVLFLEMSLFSL